MEIRLRNEQVLAGKKNGDKRQFACLQLQGEFVVIDLGQGPT